MNRPIFIFILAALALLVAGCSSSMEKTLAKTPKWGKYAQHMAAEGNSAPGGLIWQPFPDLNNPLHREIWEIASKQVNIGDGFGRICKYYDSYLVVVSDPYFEYSSFFYHPRIHKAMEGSYSIAFNFYRGNREATPTNVISLIEHLLAAEPIEAFIINKPNNIPHTLYSKDNPKVPFKDMLLSKGIIITPPTLMEGVPKAYLSKHDEYNVYVYQPLGGQIFRYELQCGKGIVFRVNRYCIAEEIGDFSVFY